VSAAELVRRQPSRPDAPSAAAPATRRTDAPGAAKGRRASAVRRARRVGERAERPPPTLNEAVDVALRYLASRPRSEREVRLRLRRGGLDDAGIDRVLDRLRAHGLVDDAAFAHYWVEQRQTFRPRGGRLLEAELRRHGIATELAAEAAEPTSETAAEDAYRAAYKRAQQLRGLDARTFRTRLGQFLARRGFDWDVVGPTVERLWDEGQRTRDG